MRRVPGRPSGSSKIPRLGALVLLAAFITFANYSYYHNKVASTQPSVYSTSHLQSQLSPYATDAVADADADHDHVHHPRDDVDADHTHHRLDDDDEPPAAAAVVIKATTTAAAAAAASTGEASAVASSGPAEVWMPSDAPCAPAAPPQPRIGQCSPARHATKEAGRPLNVRAASFRSDACSPSGLQAGLCRALRCVASPGAEAVLVVFAGATLDLMPPFLEAAAAAAVVNLLPVAADQAAAAALEKRGVLHYRMGAAALDVTTAKWAAARDVLAVGCAVTVVEPTVIFKDHPHAYLFRDADVEAMSLTSRESEHVLRGKVVGIDDAAMGWSRYAQTMAVNMVSSSLLHLAATDESFHLAAHMAGVRPPQSSEVTLNRQLFLPAANGETRAGVSVRVMLQQCFRYSTPGGGGGDHVALDMASEAHPEKAMQAALGPSSAWVRARGVVTDMAASLSHLASIRQPPAAVTPGNAIITSAELTAGKAAYAAHGCTPRPAAGPPPRPLNLVVRPSEAWPPADQCRAEGLERLCATLSQIDVNREVLAAVSNKNIFHMLGMYIEGVRKANVTNAMVVALDEETGAFCRSKGFPYWVRTLTSRTGQTDNHATSGLKFQILRDFMAVGASVVLSDVDIVWVQSPFRFLYRDADVEGMTDGWDDVTAYGWEWASASTSWPAPVATQRHMRLSARNSGLFSLRATHENLAMMRRLAHRMATEDVWDQTAYNEEQFYASYGSYHSPGVTQRLMNYLCFQNSKLLWRYVREDAAFYPTLTPVSVHVNYHPEKPNRMVDLLAQYHDGKEDAIGKWHWGVGLKANKECVKRSGDKRGFASTDVGRKMAASGKATWGGVGGLEFHSDGRLTTPWGSGTWGLVDLNKNWFFADFIGAEHRLEVAADGWPHFRSVRCSDGDVVQVKFE